MRLLTIMLCAVVLGANAQSKKVTESVTIDGQSDLELEFTFADDITFKTWDKKEVVVEVSVNINDGEYNDIFSLETKKSTSTITITMDKDMWDKVDRKDRNGNCSWRTDINYTVYAPKNMEITATTISGNYSLTYSGAQMNLNTVSGEIDLTVPAKESLDFKAKTISGGLYSDIEITFPDGKEGLRQIVGQNIKGRIGGGGNESQFETISGNIYLRKG